MANKNNKTKFSASLSSIRLDGLRFKVIRIIKHDFYSYYLYSIVYIFLITPFLFKK